MRRGREPRWVPRIAVEAVHADQVREHGGLAGLRDEAALDAALARARNTWGYDQEADLAVLAAAYGFGISANHPFQDGNKRTAFLGMAMFLGLNGYQLDAAEEEVVHVVRGVAAGEVSETSLGAWVRKRMRRIVR